MDSILDSILAYLLNVDNVYLYIFLFVSSFVENIFPPAPGDTITVFGAFLVGTGRLDFLMVYAVTGAGSTIGFMSLFLLGKCVDRKFFHGNRFSFFSDEAIGKALSAFGRYGYYIVLANRFLPGVRSVISIAAGMAELSTRKVFVLASMSALAWNFIWIQAGFMLGDNWDRVKSGITEILRSYNIIAVVCIVLAIIYLFVKKILVKNGD